MCRAATAADVPCVATCCQADCRLYVQRACCDAYGIMFSVITSDEAHWWVQLCNPCLPDIQQADSLPC